MSDWVPRPAQPYERGNVASLKHGSFSARRVDPVAVELVAGLLHKRPDLERYPETVHAWARAEARCLLLADWVAEHGFVNPDGRVAPCARFIVSFERLAVDLRARLGLDPRAEAELHRARVEAEHATVDLDAIRAQGRQVLEARVTKDDEPDEAAS